MLEGELENNSRKPRNLIRKLAQWQPKKVKLTLSQGKEMKGDEDVYEDDDDAVRTSVSQDRMPVTLCTEEQFLSAQCIWLTPDIRQV